MKDKFEAVIVGLGPAGMAAAVELATRGCNIAVLDENAGPGGQIYRQPPSDFIFENKKILGIRHRMGQRLIEAFNKLSQRITVLNQTYVWGYFAGLFESVDESTVICRCEHITAGELFSGIENGYRNINEIKRTRVAMGPCQGRICESIITQLMILKGIPIDDIGYLSLRPPLSPVPLSALESYAKSGPETGPIDGHIITNADFVSSSS